MSSARVTVPHHVAVREVQGELVILNLDDETYFGLDKVGTRMWHALTGASSVDAAFNELLKEYEVEPDVLRSELDGLLERLADRHLLEVTAS